jgi:hypothetical protein
MLDHFTNLEKAEAAEREVKQRQRVYAHLLQRGKITETKASYEISIMKNIAAHFRALHEKQDALL